jgi:hypothetical protein
MLCPLPKRSPQSYTPPSLLYDRKLCLKNTKEPGNVVFDPAKRYTMPKVPLKPAINIVVYLDAPLWGEEFAGHLGK